MNTIWEYNLGADIVDAVPATEDVLSAEGAEVAPVRGRLWLRQTGLLPFRLFFGRRPFQKRYSVLSKSGSGEPPRLQLFLVSGA